jgi:hypothetical protein
MKKLFFCLLVLTSFNFYAQTPLNLIVTYSNPTCYSSSGSITIIGRGGTAPYQFSIDGGVTFSNSNSFYNLTAGNYDCTIKDAVGNLANFLVTLDLSVAFTASVTTTNQSITTNVLGGVPPYKYSIDQGVTFSLSNTFSNVIPGDYSIYVLDSNNCSLAINATVPSSFSVTTTVTNTDCVTNTGIITLNTNGGQAPFTYSIDNQLSYQQSNTFTNVAPGNYNIFTKDALGAIFRVTTYINPKLESAVSTTTDSVTIYAFKGVPPYRFSIDGGVTLVSVNSSVNTFTGLTPGTYGAFVSDANNCSVLNNVTLNPILTIASPTISNVSCKAGADGTITVTASGGQPPYLYGIGDLNNLTPSNVFTNLSAGIYSVFVKDTANYIAEFYKITITEPPLLSVTSTTIGQILTINATGGVPPYSYSMDGAGYFPSNITVVPGGPEYTTYVKDANGCIAKNTVFKTAPPVLIGSTSPTTATVNLVAGKTLGDIPVQGTNVQWFAGPRISTSGRISSSRFSSKSLAEIPLPLNTLVEDGKTYYASQTIDGFESGQRLAVTVNLTVLATEDFILTNFKYSPNPVKSTLTVSNSSIIDEIAITSVMGKTILTKQINNLSSDIDLSGLSNGVYFLKVKSEGKEKIVKILK